MSMIRLWRYWPVRAVVLLPAVPFPVIAGFAALFFFPGEPAPLSVRGDFVTRGFFPGESAAAIAAVAGMLVCAVGWRIAILPLDAAAVREPPAWRSAGQQGRTLAALWLPIILLATGVILLINLDPRPPGDPKLHIFEYQVFGILGIIPPFLLMLHARPRGRRHWAYLGLCLPAMIAATLAAPFAIVYGGQALFTDYPGGVIDIALVAFVYAALNAPFAILLIRSGACALKYELAEETR